MSKFTSKILLLLLVLSIGVSAQYSPGQWNSLNSTATGTTALITDDFISGSTASNTDGSLGWLQTTIGSAPAYATSIGVWPHVGIAKWSTNAAATAGQGGTLSLVAGGLGIVGSNPNWTATFIFALEQTTATRYRVGLSSSVSSVQPIQFIGMRFDTNAPAQATIVAAPTGAVRDATGKIATFTTGVHGFNLVGQTVTIAGVTDTTFNGACVIASIPSTSTFTCANVGTANATSGSGTATPVAETTFKFENTAGNITTSVTVVDSGVVADLNYHKLIISSNTTGIVNYQLDSLAPVSVNTNISVANLTPVFTIAADATAQKTVDVDFFGFIAVGLSR